MQETTEVSQLGGSLDYSKASCHKTDQTAHEGQQDAGDTLFPEINKDNTPKHKMGPSVEITFEPLAENMLIDGARDEAYFEVRLLIDKKVSKLAQKYKVLPSKVLTKLQEVETEVEERLILSQNTRDLLMQEGQSLDSRISLRVFNMFKKIHGKIEADIVSGVSMKSWGKRMESLERRIKFFEKKNYIERAVLGRQEIKILEMSKAEKALGFSREMIRRSRECETKRIKEFSRWEKEISRAEIEAKSNEARRKAEVSQTHLKKALNSISAIQERKKLRVITRAEGDERQRKVKQTLPLFKKLDQSYRKQEDLLYNHHGRPQEDLDKFKVQKQDYHRLRNKLRLHELLKPGNLKSKTRAISSIHSRIASATNNKSYIVSNNDDVDDSYMSIRFARLPMLKMPHA